MTGQHSTQSIHSPRIPKYGGQQVPADSAPKANCPSIQFAKTTRAGSIKMNLEKTELQKGKGGHWEKGRKKEK